MKKRTLAIAILGIAVAASFSFAGNGNRNLSLSKLKAHAQSYCTPGSSDCKSDVTGNIYIGYVPSKEWTE